MPVAIELTLTTRPGHYEQALETYLAFVDSLEENVEDLGFILVAGEPSQDAIHAVGIYETAEVAEGLVSLPFFAAAIDALQPHLAEAPDRAELELLSINAPETDIVAPKPGQATLVEIRMQAKLGHVDDVIALHQTFVTDFQLIEADAPIVLETIQRAGGHMRTFALYQHATEAAAEGVGPLVQAFYDALDPFLTEPARRTEMHLVHAFARG